MLDGIGDGLVLESFAQGVCGCDDEGVGAGGSEKTGFGGDREQVGGSGRQIVGGPWLGQDLDLLGALFALVEDFEAKMLCSCQSVLSHVGVVQAIATSVSTSGTSGPASTAGAGLLDILQDLQAEQVLARRRLGLVSRVGVLSLFIYASENVRDRA